MFRRSLAALALAALVGCSSEGGMFGTAETTDEKSQLAAYAASTQYPTNAQASNDIRAAAMVEKDGNRIRIVNFTDQPLQNVNVWINGSFVHKVSSIPANGSVTLSRDSFYNSAGQKLSDVSTVANKIQLQSGNQLYNLMGPVSYK